ncbi:ROK family transcriptional regulator [Litchfieldia salsa]|uniref:Sugar kinase of the NBD/HSP70 family, may contain an N-terminal HTH domain n=1 Tax=Litchfieldia salsa TaxID=930152 RepID=A0A1H0PAN9_9BACI|nr:ROK family transcriptional regulator [Litchfieldia salsa]SDP02142.1 Sugar kinase of the NBD/HSP70 family, may contain an N-terminal HTH domain [Litchfieldia salsa]
MQLTWNQQVVKRNNKSLVLQMIKEQTPLSRAEISQRTGLNKSTVSSLVTELLDDELVYETGPGESSGGRRPVMLLFNHIAGYSIGIDIGVNYLLGILTDLQGKIISEKNIPLHELDYKKVMNQVNQMITHLIDMAPTSRYGVVGIGIGVPGIVDEKGEILLAPNLGWKDTLIKEELEETFQLPVIIENEANAGAYGEMRFGAGQLFENITYISASIGIGVGFILKSELYRGKNGFSGESGHMMIDMNGRKCSCGRNGCWEAYASEHALLNEAKQLLKVDLTLEQLIDEGKKANPEVIALFKRVGQYLGIGITNLVNTLNPQQVIIGNRMSMAKEYLQETVNYTILEQSLPFHHKNLSIQFSELTIYSAALGVSAFVVENFFITEELVEQT